MVDYDFSMGTRQFEQLAQALAYTEAGSSLSVFGDGPDGGREATWEFQEGGPDFFWNGFGVLQAKMRQFPEDPGNNLKWLERELSAELTKWAAPAPTRAKIPEKLLLVTNVRLSPGTGGGKESILKSAADMSTELGLSTLVRVWDYADLCTRIDSNESVRRTYGAWILPGDILAALLDVAQAEESRLSRALTTHAARSFLDDAGLSLRQAGSVADQPLSLFDVFTDVPAEPLRWDASQPYASRAEELLKKSAVTASLVRLADDAVRDGGSSSADEPTRRVVLVGGPGQGKSTVTQYLAQLYRSAFLEGTTVASSTDVSRPMRQLKANADAREIPVPVGRRWPIRIILSDFADALARAESSSLLDYIADVVSRKSAISLRAEDLLTWLGRHPWLLLIDGLDEVPVSSNRGEVLKAIRDFYLEAESAQADLVCIATTRPQGYNEEFSAERYAHLALTKLTKEQSMAYAAVLVEARSGHSTEASERTLKRLQRSSEDESTSRLFSSPLQVAILTVLVEKLGQVPSDRWRLFSQYYDVMTNREREKGGALSDLLLRHESDVDYIHRRIAFELQGRNAEVGETSATISRSEFEEIITSRLREQEHGEAEIVRLVAQFMALTTERLVFLAALTADTIGFEIRSLQEFMTGEYIVSLPERDVIPLLSSVAGNAYWRNVVLFAAGKIFIEREPLKSELLRLCAELDLENEVSQIIKPGADLALDILLDGSPNSQPRYSKPLAERAATLVRGVPNDRTAELAGVREGEAGRILRRVAGETSVAPSATWVNRVRSLAAMAKNGDSTSVDALTRAFRTADAEALQSIVEFAWSSGDKDLSSVASTRLLDINPLRLNYFGSPRHDTTPDRDALYTALRSIMNRGLEPGASVTLSEQGPISLSLAVPSPSETWDLVAAAESTVPEWDFISRVAQFVMEPGTDALVNCLEASLGVAHDLHLRFRQMPWVLSACLTAVADEAAGDEETRVEVVGNLVRIARQGELGTPADWSAIEERMYTFTSDWLTHAGSSNLPVSPQMRVDGLPWHAFWGALSMPQSEADCIELLNFAFALGKAATLDAPDAFKKLAASNSMFALANVWGWSDESPHQLLTPELESSIVELAAGLLEYSATGYPLYWCDWLSALSPASWTALESNGVLSTIARSPQLSPRIDGRVRQLAARQAFAQWLLGEAEKPTGDAWLARLAVVFNPALLIDLEQLSVAFADPVEEEMWERLKALQLVRQASADAIMSGDHDGNIERLAAGDNDNIGLSLLIALVQDFEVTAPREMAARSALILADRDVGKSAQFAMVAREEPSADEDEYSRP